MKNTSHIKVLPTKFGGFVWLLISSSLLFTAEGFSQTVEWIASTERAPWVEQKPLTLSASRDFSPYDLEIKTGEREQTIAGWGGCFNELGWEALKVLPPEQRDAVLKEIFDPQTGLNFTICRRPIGASDYATNWYSLDDTPGDFALKHFNLKRDQASLIPFIKAAMKFQPNLQVWGSPWSPPVWMKVNQTYNATGTNQFIQEEKYLSSYALYLAKYVQAYRAEGIPVFAVAVQNEPFASQVFPSCVWSPEELRDFIGKYVGPVFEREKVSAQIWLGTFNNNQFSAFETALSDPVAAKYISAVGMQWAGKNALPEINAKYPHLQKIQTETECGNGSFDWKAAEYTFSLMKHYLNHGVSVYSYWNMILDETGKSTWGWKQNALVSINQTTKQASYTPEFYLYKHFSHFVPKGSVKVKSYGNFDDAIAFLDSDGKVVLVAVNSQPEPRSVDIKIGGHSLNVSLPAKSFNTFRFSAE